MDKLKIVYIGKDELFSNGILGTIEEFYDSNNVKLSTLFLDEVEEDLLARFVPEIIAETPDIIILDFSFKFKQIKSLARYLRITLDSKKITCVGVLNQPGDAAADDIDEYDQLKLAGLTQVPLIHFKGTDFKKILFDAIYLNNGDQELRTEFATIKSILLEVESHYFSCLTHILKNSLVIESSLQLEKGDYITMDSEEISAIDNKTFLVSEKSSELLSTKFNLRYKLDMEFKADEPEPKDSVEGEEGETYVQSKNVDLHRLKKYVKSLDREADFNRFKLLIIQNDLDVLTQISKPMSEYPFLIRYKSNFSSELSMVRNFRPNIIALELSSVKPVVKDEESKDDKEDDNSEDLVTVEDIKLLTQEINQIDDYSPIVQLFNCPELTPEAMEQLGYKLIMSSTTKMSFDLLLNMLNIFKTKKNNEVPFSNDPFIDIKEDPFSVYALSKESRLGQSLNLKLTSINEKEITFVSDIELPMRGVLQVETPVPMYLTITEPIEALENVKGGFHYFGLINGITPTNAQALRKYVNSLFFTDKEDQKQQELESFQNLNKDKKEEMDNEILRVAEEKVQKEKDDAEAKEREKVIREDQALKVKEKKESEN